MKVYLVRHGEALPKESDSECPLSDKGKKDLKSIAKFLRPLHLSVTYFFHSGKLRAEQTAQILSKAVYCKSGIEKRDGLDPLDLVSPIAAEINRMDEDLILIGHMPFMGKLLAKLITGYENKDLFMFQTASLICLERRESGEWLIKWSLCSELF